MIKSVAAGTSDAAVTTDRVVAGAAARLSHAPIHSTPPRKIAVQIFMEKYSPHHIVDPFGADGRFAHKGCQTAPKDEGLCHRIHRVWSPKSVTGSSAAIARSTANCSTHS